MALQSTITERPISLLARITGAFVYMFERLLPEPFVFAVLLTILTAILAAIFAPKHGVPDILAGWYGGIFQIFPFAFQMVLVLVTGYALTSSRPVSAALKKLAAMPKTPRQAVALTVLVALTTVTLNWGFGLIASAMFAREIAKRIGYPVFSPFRSVVFTTPTTGWRVSSGWRNSRGCVTSIS